MKNILTIALVLALNFVTAQSAMQSLKKFTKDFVDNENKGTWVNNTVDKRIKGTPYLFDTWVKDAKIYYGEDVYQIYSFNYNLQFERFEAKYSDNSVLAINPRGITKIVVDNMNFVRQLDPEFKRNTYFESIVKFNGNSLLRKYSISIKEGKVNPLTLQMMKPDQFVKNEKIYVCYEESNEMQEIKLKKSTVLALIDNENKEEVKAFVEKNRLRYKDVEDVHKILNHYNSL